MSKKALAPTSVDPNSSHWLDDLVSLWGMNLVNPAGPAEFH